MKRGSPWFNTLQIRQTYLNFHMINNSTSPILTINLIIPPNMWSKTNQKPMIINFSINIILILYWWASFITFFLSISFEKSNKMEEIWGDWSKIIARFICRAQNPYKCHPSIKKQVPFTTFKRLKSESYQEMTFWVSWQSKCIHKSIKLSHLHSKLSILTRD